MNADRHQRAMQVFQQALEREARNRARFLSTACAGDHTLHSEVGSLLDHHDSRTITLQRKTRAAAQSKLHSDKAVHRLVPSALRPANRERLVASGVALGLAIVLAVIGYRVKANVDNVLRENLGNQLQATLLSNIAAVTNWLRLQQHELNDWAQHPRLREHFPALVRMAQASDISLDKLRESPLHAAVSELLSPLLEAEDIRAVNGADTAGLLVFTSRDSLHERYQLTPHGTRAIAPVFLGQEILLPPTLGRTLVDNELPGVVDEPILLLGSPVRDADSRVVGGLFASIDAGREFTRLLRLGRTGDRGENYAFGADNLLLTGLETQPADASRRPMAAVAVAAMAAPGEIQINLDGYENRRGTRVVGASKWLDQFGFGVVSEVEFDAAYAAARYVRRLLNGLFGLLLLTSAVAFISSLSALRLRREIGRARQLGQYTLEELIAEGGMGRVYKARHALLRRPTAVKVLDGDRADSRTIARFEREAQVVSALTHPNTVEIYDYGRTEDGIFYFAMEYLPGLTLDELVKRHGATGTPRMLHLFRQVLGSLAEAHDAGLIHRDIKPANIMLCRRGGLWDFVKVLDFGLTKDLGFQSGPKLTQTGAIGGTPLYIAPECLDGPDHTTFRSDIYALGVVAFYLLTGRDLFIGENWVDVLQQVSRKSPPRVSDLVGRVVPEQLDDLIARCVAKDPAERPLSVHEMLAVIESLRAGHMWTAHDAENWWREHEPQFTMATADDTQVIGPPEQPRSLNT